MLREKPAHFTLPFLRRERDRVSQPPAPGKILTSLGGAAVGDETSVRLIRTLSDSN